MRLFHRLTSSLSLEKWCQERSLRSVRRPRCSSLWVRPTNFSLGTNPTRAQGSERRNEWVTKLCGWMVRKSLQSPSFGSIIYIFRWCSLAYDLWSWAVQDQIPSISLAGYVTLGKWPKVSEPFTSVTLSSYDISEIYKKNILYRANVVVIYWVRHKWIQRLKSIRGREQGAGLFTAKQKWKRPDLKETETGSIQPETPHFPLPSQMMLMMGNHEEFQTV